MVARGELVEETAALTMKGKAHAAITMMDPFVFIFVSERRKSWAAVRRTVH